MKIILANSCDIQLTLQPHCLALFCKYISRVLALHTVPDVAVIYDASKSKIYVLKFSMLLFIKYLFLFGCSLNMYQIVCLRMFGLVRVRMRDTFTNIDLFLLVCSTRLIKR